MSIIISPSILSADFARLGEEVNAVLAAGADWIHFDVMDNHYVPNLTVGPLVCEALRNAGVKAPIDVHLMVSPVDPLVSDFAKAGASIISFHPEATEHVDRTIEHIRDSGCKPGLVFNPATSLELAGLCDRQDRRRLVDVGQSGFWRDKNSFRRCSANSPRHGRESRPAAARYGLKSTAASRWKMRHRSPKRAPIPSWPAPRYSAVPTMPPPSRRCARRSRSAGGEAG